MTTTFKQNEDSETILVAGCGVSGRAAARLAASLGLDFSLLDENDSPELRAFLETLPTKPKRVWFGFDPKTAELPDVSTTVLSPGFRKGNPVLAAIRERSARIVGELEFALERCGKPFVGITGTNGKTTTTELTAELFRAVGVRATACGNNGYAMSDAARDCLAGRLDLPIVEISSFQLEAMKNPRPIAAAILNLASDHIDRHGSFEAYAAAKIRLFSWRETKCVANSAILPLLETALNGRKAYSFSATDPTADFHVGNGALRFRDAELARLNELKLRGAHNFENALAASALLASVSGEAVLSDPRVRNALADFSSGEHRMECFLQRDGIRYVDDSKATNPHAVNAALADLPERTAVILLGGLDKDMNFKELRKSASKISSAFLFGSCADRIAEAIKDVVDCRPCGGFEEAVRNAVGAAKPGDTVLLSPATASMDLFRDYRERGNRFKELVRNLVEPAKNEAERNGETH